MIIGYDGNTWLTSEKLVDIKKEIRKLDTIGEIAKSFNEVYQKLSSIVANDYRDPKTFKPYDGNDEYRELIKKELLMIKRSFTQIKIYLLLNNMLDDRELLCIIFDQLLNLHYEVDIRMKQRLKQGLKNK